ncbi:arsenate-mycothiol transferase ArsC [Chloroflexus sp.]|uniref:arsenate-mycothiol transferase ArsC n=1 Tax=Chloroflexus sp. TaxID=1904827 RepID=UPI00404B822B
MKKTILFICTGNYYRSRYAELLFNAMQVKGWQATSRGLALSLRNHGPVWPPVLERLQQGGFTMPDELPLPRMLSEADLAQATQVIALNEPEHRPLMQQHFPAWVDRIAYWQIPDTDVLDSEPAFQRIEAGIAALQKELSGS